MPQSTNAIFTCFTISSFFSTSLVIKALYQRPEQQLQPQRCFPGQPAGHFPGNQPFAPQAMHPRDFTAVFQQPFLSAPMQHPGPPGFLSNSFPSSQQWHEFPHRGPSPPYARSPPPPNFQTPFFPRF